MYTRTILLQIFVFLSFSILALKGISSDVEETKQDEKGIELSENESLVLCRPLPNAEKNVFIDSLEPETVLFSITTEPDLNVKNEFHDFCVVCFQAGRGEDAYYFVPEEMKEDAEKALSIFGKTERGFYAYLVPIEDSNKFWELAQKTSMGCGNKRGKWREDVKWCTHNWEKLYNEGFCLLDRDKIRAAKTNTPSQPGGQGDWTCGPNSGHRALTLLGETLYLYENFVAHCPQRISKRETVRKCGATAGVGVALTIVGAIFAPVTGGWSLVPGLAVTTVGAGGVIGGVAISSNVGPKPDVLANYLSKRMKDHYAEFVADYYAYEYERHIVDGIKNGLPSIALLISGTFSMHYVNIIGVKPTEDGMNFTDAVILNTDGSIGVIYRGSLEYWLDRNGVANLIIDAPYNTVAFVRKGGRRSSMRPVMAKQKQSKMTEGLIREGTISFLGARFYFREDRITPLY